MFKIVLVSCVLLLLGKNEAARILAYYPSASISHQVVFRPLTLELVKRGHEVVVITTDPIYPNKDGPPNLKEIDLHDLSYAVWGDMLKKVNHNFDRRQILDILKTLLKLVEAQVASTEVQALLSDKSQHFDLFIVEVFVGVTLGMAHHFNVPTIQFSSLGASTSTLNQFGAPIHPFVYPVITTEKFNLTSWEKVVEIYEDISFLKVAIDNMDVFESALKRMFGSDCPSLSELNNKVDMLFLNVHSLWDHNRPVPPNIVYLGGLHQKPKKELPEDLQKYLDSSKNGVVYVSFGTNVDPGKFPPAVVQTLINVFSKLPYDVLWKWNQDELPGRTPNIKISKWLPQSDLLRHPKVKLFVTQAGLQSTGEAITAEVPMVAVPVFSDQFYNAEQYTRFGIGEKIDIKALTEESLSNAINTVLNNESYRKNIAKLNVLLSDEPQTPLQRAVWWTEYVIRHKGAKHLRTPAADISLAEYYELKIVFSILLALLVALVAIVSIIYFVLSFLCRSKTKVKTN